MVKLNVKSIGKVFNIFYKKDVGLTKRIRQEKIGQ